MLELLWTVPALPLAGFLVLVIARGELSDRASAVIGVGSTALAALSSLGIAVQFLPRVSEAPVFRQSLGGWIEVGDFQVGLGLYLDALAMVMVLVITGVGFLIHLYSVGYMRGDSGVSRFFAYMNLFMAAMLVLVLAEDLLLLYLGWEGVGLCSYLLIGFWYRDAANGYAARKAFVVTRAGDTAMLIGLLLLVSQLGTLNIQGVMEQASERWAIGSGIATAAAALLLCGALGKSAQLPLQTWLPDAMAGPTPVSALIHAATMVTAGMYLIARTHVLFALAPTVQFLVGVIGALTLLLAGTSALFQRDIKRILAYSTMSQIGYMFLALGVGAWSAAVFHFMTHAFFKALLFLAAGVVIIALHHRQDIFEMGGLRRRLPLAFWSFLIGSASLAALPLVTAGFYSKDQVLLAAWAAEGGNRWLWLAGLIGSLLTSVYIFRALLITFFGEPRFEEALAPITRAMRWPLPVLAVLALVGGCVETTPALGNITLFSRTLSSVLPATRLAHATHATELVLLGLGAAASLSGLAIAYLLYRRGRVAGHKTTLEEATLPAVPRSLRHFWADGWGFDRLYDVLFVRPFMGAARANRDDPTDRVYDGVVFAAREAWHAARQTQTGGLRWYAASMIVGVVFVVALAVVS